MKNSNFQGHLFGIKIIPLNVFTVFNENSIKIKNKTKSESAHIPRETNLSDQNYYKFTMTLKSCC